jgi:dimethylhistidine N-methyltransferase
MQSPSTQPVVSERFSIVAPDTIVDDFALDVRRGLTASPKTLPAKYFYDDLGSVLFEGICRLPEYYVSRAEEEILDVFGDEIVQSFGTPIRLIELGSGTSRKTRPLLDRLTRSQPELEYVAVDIDEQLLRQTARTLSEIYPSLVIHAVAADFRQIARILPPAEGARRRNVVLFLGSTIGNLDRDEQGDLLRAIREPLRIGDMLFLGADQKKAAEVLEPAYDDALGVTAAFNLNLLVRMNRELGGEFHLPNFRHRAFFNEAASRIEMHIVSTIDQRVRIDALNTEIAFRADESIHTENSYKFDEAGISELARRTGFAVTQRWTDSQNYFADHLLVARSLEPESV